MKKVFLGFVLMGAALFCFAETVGGVKLPDTLQIGGEELVLNGAGLRRKAIIKVYAGGLYLKNRSSDRKEIIEADETMAIRLTFVRNVDSGSIIDAWNTGFENSAAEGYTASQDNIDRFNAVFSSDVEKNSTYEVAYIPGFGVQASINGSQKALIPGLDFKQALFAIWLGEEPADKGLKEGMLGD
jgi:hypothetical protein